MRKWKTYFLVCVMQSRWIPAFLTRIGRPARDALQTPDPEPGDEIRWEFLGDLSEMARYAVIAGYIRRLRPNGSVLDVGASTGILAEELKRDVSMYRGLERDPASVDKARERNIDVAEFVIADANSYSTTDEFDVIVFNETMYYLNDPIHILHRYAGYLKAGGIIITSNFVARHLLRMPREIARNFDVVDQTTVINSPGLGWIIQAVRQPAAVGESTARAVVRPAWAGSRSEP